MGVIYCEGNINTDMMTKPKMLGDKRDTVPLLPISNRTVKCVIADDSVVATMRK